MEEEEGSSNYKELRNFVNTVSEEVGAGRLRDCKFFLFVNNSTAEGCFYRANSKSCILHALVLALQTLDELRHDYACLSHLQKEDYCARH